MTVAFPKPVRVTKEWRPLKRKTPLRARAKECAGSTPARLPRLGSKKAVRLREADPVVQGTSRRKAGGGYETPPQFPKPQRERGTKHRRRQRELGRMLFYKSLPCMFYNPGPGQADRCFSEQTDPRGVVLIAVQVEACCGPVEVAHLGPRAGYRRCPDNQTAPLCRRHHRQPGIDGDVGGRAPWYVALSGEDRRFLRRLLWERAEAAWMALTPENRAAYDELAAVQLEARRLRRAA